MFRYNIQKQFVIVSIDKAANNFSFMNDSKERQCPTYRS